MGGGNFQCGVIGIDTSYNTGNKTSLQSVDNNNDKFNHSTNDKDVINHVNGCSVTNNSTIDNFCMTYLDFSKWLKKNPHSSSYFPTIRDDIAIHASKNRFKKSKIITKEHVETLYFDVVCGTCSFQYNRTRINTKSNNCDAQFETNDCLIMKYNRKEKYVSCYQKDANDDELYLIGQELKCKEHSQRYKKGKILLKDGFEYILGLSIHGCCNRKTNDECDLFAVSATI